MENLFVIFEECGKTVIKKVEIVKETEKQLIIHCEGVTRKAVNKNLIERFIDEYIFGYDKEVLIELWNSHNEANIAYLKKQLQRVKNLVVTDDVKAILLNDNSIKSKEEVKTA